MRGITNVHKSPFNTKGKVNWTKTKTGKSHAPFKHMIKRFRKVSYYIDISVTPIIRKCPFFFWFLLKLFFPFWITITHIIKPYIKFTLRRFIAHPKQLLFSWQIFEFVIEVACQVSNTKLMIFNQFKPDYCHFMFNTNMPIQYYAYTTKVTCNVMLNK